MTEDEAKTKTCPQTMASNDWDKCIGSGCMAWRWRDEIKSASLTIGVVVTGKSAVDGWCGLVGEP